MWKSSIDCNQNLLSAKHCVKTRLFFGNYQNTKHPEIRFYLYTRNNLYEGQELKLFERKTIVQSNFNIRWPIRIFIHGWRAGPRSCACGIIKDAYLNTGNYNIIIMDWSDFACKQLESASNNVKFAGEKLAEFTTFLKKSFRIPYERIYLIGHSLGAHVAGHAGLLISPRKYNTIFALDPAAPFFSGKNPSDRLDPTDANYVESITTAIHMAGYSKPNIGHSSIYPNFGDRYQPECARKRFRHNLKEMKDGKVGRFCKYYMGGDPSRPKDGVFYTYIKNY
ncbi:hepatic triacylglycerol lipase-like [Condylostylus longicornis]|uniref:hepatic triacylglycerol lipase-like n=1 Tax=Condylostylus longicornis TaxID=2530218 RepID=UPI00244DF4F5|nr:hepatic triacylglycerol lipase-like [Condylostylus longicornis]